MPDLYNPGKFCPPTAQHATRQATVLANNIVAAMSGRDLRPFKFKTLGLLATIGRRTGVAEILGMRFSGIIAWCLWRAIYLGKLPGPAEESSRRPGLDARPGLLQRHRRVANLTSAHDVASGRTAGAHTP